MVWFVGFGCLRKHRAEVMGDTEVERQRVCIVKNLSTNHGEGKTPAQTKIKGVGLWG